MAPTPQKGRGRFGFFIFVLAPPHVRGLRQKDFRWWGVKVSAYRSLTSRLDEYRSLVPLEKKKFMIERRDGDSPFPGVLSSIRASTRSARPMLFPHRP